MSRAAPVPVKDTFAMIARMNPRLDNETYIFGTLASISDPPAELLASALSLFQEGEGTSLIVPEKIADRHGLDTSQPMQRIILQVHSDLEGVGLTAAVATALTAAGIPCNMVAAFHHDYVFVPEDDAEDALECLQEVQKSARAESRKARERKSDED